MEFETSAGTRPVAEWRDDLDEKQKAHIDAKIDLIERSPILRKSVLKPIEGRKGIFELLFSFRREEFRILICKDTSNTQNFVMLSGHKKKGRKLKKGCFDTADDRRKEVEKNAGMAKERDW